ncbi:gluconate 2-dehydrogenase subunit 3 family protein [uncultured Polaribacter sp.]|uniref:gluconate 2-dehydrogenase subunit 3 family protein n=1 Tax=uncultured Polaribacter sp. TaxID=174711 RepID=UPI00261B3DA3|nr:gluconate 2-dehydrogenase subunit 3 family protein [uncultured Polaribacter sp.]
MKRREAIKNIGLAAGFTLVAPSILSMLQSCTSNVETWVPAYLNSEEKVVLTNLVDVILPKTATTPAASEVKVPQFIDKYIAEVLSTEDQKLTREAFGKIIHLLKKDETTNIDKVTTEQYISLLDKHLLVKGEVDAEREANLTAKTMTNSEFLNQLKWMTINGYKTSEEIGENVLVYDPIPTAYYCGDLQELTGGKAYSL